MLIPRCEPVVATVTVTAPRRPWTAAHVSTWSGATAAAAAAADAWDDGYSLPSAPTSDAVGRDRTAAAAAAAANAGHGR